MAKNELVPVTTPKGELHYVNISGQGKENYNEDGYEYTATVYIPKENCQELMDKCLEVIGEVPKGKNLKSKGFRELLKDAEGNLFFPTANKSEGEPSGIIAFPFKTGTTFADGKTKKIGVFNKDAQKINLGDRKIGNGSVGKISGKLKRNENGKDISCSLYLHAIQLTSFTEYVDDAGFETEEGDFSGVSDEDTGFETETDTEETTAAPAKGKTKPRL